MSITLTNSLTINQGVSVVESNPQSAAMGVAMDFQLGLPSLSITLRAGRNAAENFAVNNAVVVGTQVAW